MSVALGLRLLASGALSRGGLETALLAHMGQEKAPFIRTLLDSKVIDEESLENELAESDLPVLRTVKPLATLSGALPEGLARRLLALPVRQDPYTGTVDIAVVDPFDPHIAEEFSYHLGLGIRRVRASLASIEEALGALEGERVEADGDSSDEASLGHPGEPDISEGDLVEADHRPASPLSPDAKRPPFADLEPFIEGIRRARDRDAIIEALLGGLQTIARGAGVLVVRRGEVRGWACNRELADFEAFRAVSISRREPSVIMAAIEKGFYLGRLSDERADAQLFSVLGQPVGEIAIVTVEVQRRPVLLLLQTELGDSLLGTKRAMRLAKLAGEALGKVLRSTSPR